MYKEVTIDPNSLTDHFSVAILRNEFGFDKGRYLSVPRNEWVKQAVDCINRSNMRDIEKKSSKNILNKLKRDKTLKQNILLTKYRSNIATECTNNWSDWNVKQKEDIPFSAIISNEKLEDSISFQDVIYEHDIWKIKTSISIDRSNIQCITESLVPLLKISERVIIIDNYLKISTSKILPELFKSLIEIKNLKKVTLVTMCKTKDIKATFLRMYGAYLPNFIEFELIEVIDKYFHDRFLITDVGAINLGQGFEQELAKGASSDKLNLYLTSSDIAKNLENDLKSALEQGQAKVKLSINEKKSS